MKIKSLLLGSAAALVAVSGARAADAVTVIPEPEVVEYVRVCDAYGTGYYYIPGTDVCIRIGGYVRYDIGFGDLNGIQAFSYDDAGTDDTSDDTVTALGNATWNKRARASFQVRTATETDYGTLRTYVETRWQYDTNGTSPYAFSGTVVGDPAPTPYGTAGEFSINFAYIDLNGFRVGKDESFFTTFTGYGGSVINDTTGGGYGPFDTNLMSYTWSGGAISAGISLEQQAGSVLIDDYVPHVAAGLGFDAGVVNLRTVAGYDTTNNAWAAKVRADADLTDAISAFLMVMYGENASGYTSWATGAATANTWSVLGGASVALTDATTFNTQVQWAEGNGGSDVWHVAANVNHNLTPTMIVRPEVQWLRDNAGTSAWGGVLRFQVSY